MSSAGLSIGIDAKNHTASVTPAGGEAIEMAYGDESQVERTKKGSTAFNTNRLGLSLLSESETQTTAITRDNRGAVQGHRTKDNAERFYYLADASGSVVAVTDGQGAVRSRYEYDPYGQTKPDADNPRLRGLSSRRAGAPALPGSAARPRDRLLQDGPPLLRADDGCP